MYTLATALMAALTTGAPLAERQCPTHEVEVAGAVLGPRLGPLSVLLFLALTAVGLPVLAGGRGERLKGLTENRAKPATPFGGKFRIIDFVLSNCVSTVICRMPRRLGHRGLGDCVPPSPGIVGDTCSFVPARNSASCMTASP